MFGRRNNRNHESNYVRPGEGRPYGSGDIEDNTGQETPEQTAAWEAQYGHFRGSIPFGHSDADYKGPTVAEMPHGADYIAGKCDLFGRPIASQAVPQPESVRAVPTPFAPEGQSGMKHASLSDAEALQWAARLRESGRRGA